MYKVGEKVRILSSGCYNGKFTGMTGKIVQIEYGLNRSARNIGIKIDGEYNVNSKKGLYWFNYHYLEPYNPSSDISIVGIEFIDDISEINKSKSSNKVYDYTSYIKLFPGDIVVVKSAHNKLGVAKVVLLRPDDYKPIYGCKERQIIDKIDTTQYFKNKDNQEKVDQIKDLIAYIRNSVDLSTFKQLLSEFCKD